MQDRFIVVRNAPGDFFPFTVRDTTGRRKDCGCSTETGANIMAANRNGKT